MMINCEGEFFYTLSFEGIKPKGTLVEKTRYGYTSWFDFVYYEIYSGEIVYMDMEM